MSVPKPPKALDMIADIVLAYRPKAKTEGAKKRKRKAKKMLKKVTVSAPKEH
jgi:hypothetical protein